MTLHLAFSAGHFVDQVGKIGGFAALVGLAVLVLLYFSQAREVKRLREWAAEAPERAQELEQRLMAQTAVARRTAAAAPRPAGRPVTPAGAAAARPAIAPFAPAGLAAPDLASATRFPGLVPARPAAVPAAAPVASPTLVPAAVPAAAQAELDDAAAARSGEPGRRAGGLAAGGPTTAAPPVPAVSNGRSQDTTSIAPPPPPPAAAPPRAPAAPPPPPAGGRRSVQIRGQAAPLRAGGATAKPASARDPHGRRWAILVGAGVVVIVALVALLLTGALGGGGGGGGGSKAARSTKASGAVTSTPATKTKTKHKAQTAFVRNGTTVSVINGTVTGGLAQTTENRLHKAGFAQGTYATGADQSHSATVVYYQPGHKRDAQEVQKVLKQGAVEPLGGANSTATVCALKQTGQPQSNPCQSNVVVIVGSDVAH